MSEPPFSPAVADDDEPRFALPADVVEEITEIFELAAEAASPGIDLDDPETQARAAAFADDACELARRLCIAVEFESLGTTPPRRVRAELARLAETLDRLSPEAASWLTRDADRHVLARTGAPTLAHELARRARRADPQRWAGDAVRRHLGVDVADLLRRYEVPVDAARDGALVRLLTLLIELAGQSWDARELAQQVIGPR